MKRSIYQVFILFVITTFFIVACSGGGSEQSGATEQDNFSANHGQASVVDEVFLLPEK